MFIKNEAEGFMEDDGLMKTYLIRPSKVLSKNEFEPHVRIIMIT